MKECEFHFETETALKGTVTFPVKGTEPHPLVVIIHGSGAVDRDGNATGMKMNAYKYLAEFFASIGVAVLRYDKRGVGKSGGSFLEAGMWDLVNDGIAAVEVARRLPEIEPERIFLLGHSEGSILLPAIHKKAQAAGLVFLAGQADNVRKASEMQIKILEEEIINMKGFQGSLLRTLKVHKSASTKQKKLFDEIAQSNETIMKKMFTKINAKWIREHFQYEIDQDLAAITCPVLAVTGSKDVQVDPQHVHLFAEKVNGPAESYTVDGMNHLLREQVEPTTILKVKSIYKKNFNKPLSPELLLILEGWTNKYIKV